MTANTDTDERKAHAPLPAGASVYETPESVTPKPVNEETADRGCMARLVRFLFIGIRGGCSRGNRRSGDPLDTLKTSRRVPESPSPLSALRRRQVLRTLALLALSPLHGHLSTALRPLRESGSVDANPNLDTENQSMLLPDRRNYWWMLSRSELDETARKYPLATAGSHQMVLGTWGGVV